MYCSECGAKIPPDASFCGECGTKVQKSKETPPKKERKPLSKTQKISILVIFLVAILLFGGYKYLSTAMGPVGVTKHYVSSLKSNSIEDIYNSLSIEGDTTFTTLDEFKKVYDEDENSFKDLKDYTVDEAVYNDNKTSATVRVTIKKEDDTEKVLIATVNKSDKKKYLFFDEWKVESLTSNGYSTTGVEVLKDFRIRVPKNSKLTLNDQDVDPKFIEENIWEDGIDVYVIPNLFVSTIKIKTTLPNQMVIEDEKVLNSYSNQYEVEVSLKNLNDEMVSTLKEQVKTDISNLYNNIIAQKNWDAVKESYSYNNVNLSSLEEDYMDLYEELNSDNLTLKKLEISNVTLTNVKLNDEGKLVITAKYNYDYTVDYKSLLGEVKTKDGKSSYSSTITYDYYDKSYKINEIYNMVHYFSTW